VLRICDGCGSISAAAYIFRAGNQPSGRSRNILVAKRLVSTRFAEIRQDAAQDLEGGLLGVKAVAQTEIDDPWDEFTALTSRRRGGVGATANGEMKSPCWPCLLLSDPT